MSLIIRYHEGLYPVPQLVKNYTKECIKRNDPVGTFISENCECDVNLADVSAECLTPFDLVTIMNTHPELTPQRSNYEIIISHLYI